MADEVRPNSLEGFALVAAAALLALWVGVPLVNWTLNKLGLGIPGTGSAG